MKVIKASYTIEAALVLPILFGLIVAVLYLGFHIHDNTVTEGIAFEGAYSGISGNELKNWDVIQKTNRQVEEYVDIRLREGVLLAGSYESSVIIDDKTAEVTITGDDSKTASAKMPSQASFIRALERAMKLLNKMK